jgi:WD40 repeat protein
MIRLLTIVLILLIIPSSAIAQIEEYQELLDQLIGIWIVIQPDSESTRTMQIQEVKGMASGQKEVFEAKGVTGIAGGKMLPVSITITYVEGKFKLSFLTPAKSKVLLTLTTPERMDGTLITVEGKEMPVLLQKDKQASMTYHTLTNVKGASDVTSSNPIEPENQPSKQPILRIESGTHGARVNAVATNSENRFLVTASEDKTLRVWELPSIKLLKILRPPIGQKAVGRLFAVAMSPDGQFIACGGTTGIAWDNSFSIYIFNRESGKIVKTISGGMPGVITGLAYSKDGQYFAAALGKGGIKVFDASTGNTLFEDTNYDEKCDSVDFDPEGRLVTSSSDGYLRLYGQPFKLIGKQNIGRADYERCARFSPDGKMIAVGYGDAPKVDVYSGDNLTHLFSPNTGGGSGGDFSIVSWSVDGKTLFAGGRHRIRSDNKFLLAIRSWSVNNRFWYKDFLISDMPNPTYRINQMLSLRDGRVVWAFYDPSLGILDPANEKNITKDSEIVDVSLVGDGIRLSKDGMVVQFYFESMSKSPGSFSISERLLRRDIENISSDFLNKPVTSSEFIKVSDWQFKGTELIPKLNDKPLEAARGALCLAIAPDGKKFLIGVGGRGSSSLLFFDETGKTIWRNILQAQAWGVNISGDGKLAVAALRDGTIRWYRMNDGMELLAFCSHKDRKRWVMWTPEGYFDASPGGAELIGYHINQKKDQEAIFVSMYNLYDVFYRPDIVQAKIRGDDIREMFKLTADEALKYPPPTVKIADVPAQTDQGKIKVCYQIANSGGGIGEVRMFHNGKLIQSDGYYKIIAQSNVNKMQLTALNSRAIYEDMRSISIKGLEETIPTSSKSKGGVFDDCIEVDVIPGENTVSVTAFNSSNTVQSYMETVHFNSTVKPEDPHLYILAIGIDQYQDTGVNLKYAVKDAKDIEEKLKGQAATLYKPRNIHYMLLTDKDAIKTNIVDKINELSRVIKPHDGFVFFVAGHGVLLQNQYHMITHDYNGVVNDHSVISSNEIVEMSKKIKSLSQLLIFDTCHAGGVDYIVSGLYDARMSVLAKKMGLHIYASASDKQSAMDGYKGNGLFTYTLLDGLNNNKEADKNKDGKVTIVGLGEYSKKMTTNISKEIGHSQTPIIINFGKDSPIYKLQ